MVLLDTCSLLWLVADQDKLSDVAKAYISKHEGMIYVSAISAFEIAIKVEKKKLFLPKETEDWFYSALALHGLTEIPLTSTCLITSAQLPTYHYDPADRIIIATAKEKRLTIITPDEHIKKYLDISVIW